VASVTRDPSETTTPTSDPDYFAIESQIDRVEQEKRKALSDPGPTWRAWWFHSASKWYIGLLFLIVDVWIFSAAAEASAIALGAVAVAAAVYAEFLLYRYLYYEPPLGRAKSEGRFHRTWYRPVEYGRWTEEGEILRAGGTLPAADGGPDPHEFL
jgi:hypothetical protein